MKHVVITSIFKPTEAVKKFAARDDIKVIVVGDLKTPDGWGLNGVTYISPDEQTKSCFRLTELLPWNHYSRKMVGYLAAIRSGASVIIDTDDDNIPYENWGFPNFDGSYLHCIQTNYVNIYKYFSDDHVWPRGFPLRYLQSDVNRNEVIENARVGIWQFLADDDPDVDAIYRLVSNKIVKFNIRPPIVLREGAICPINSQNTAFRKELFPLLYLPAFVNFRFTDILRGIVAQPILWRFGFRVGFGHASVRQDRNPHDFMRDFIDEFPMYRDAEEAFKVVFSAIANQHSIASALTAAYDALYKCDIVKSEELTLLDAWLYDVGA
jgi:hypothetical protein